jgi:hypothetical protein
VTSSKPTKAERGAAKADPPTEKRWGEGRVAFMAHLDRIKTQLEAGQTARVIWESLPGNLGISYSNFARYIAKHIRSPANDRKAQVARPAPSSPGARPGTRDTGNGGGKPAGPAGTPTRFSYDPSSPDDELI